jgi:DNA-binding MarR family transcriptional regulator
MSENWYSFDPSRGLKLHCPCCDEPFVIDAPRVRRQQGTSERHAEILNFIREYSIQNGYGPTQEEIAHGVGIRSKGRMNGYINRLEMLGLVERLPNKARAIAVIEPILPHFAGQIE